MRKLLVASQKGGVGKTTTSMNLAAAAAGGGTRVLLLDADPLSNVSTALNLAEHPKRRPLRADGIPLPGVLVADVVPGLDVLSPYDDGRCSDADFDHLLRVLATPITQRGYGCLIVDGPPFLGANPAQLVGSCDELLLVMRAEAMAYRTLPAFLELIQRSSREGHVLPMRGILLTLPEGEEPGCRWERELRGRFGSRVLPEVIPHDQTILKALSAGQIGSHLHPDSPAAVPYRQLAGKLGLTGESRSTSGTEIGIEILRGAAATVPPVATAPAPVAAELGAEPKGSDGGAEFEIPAPPPEPVKPAPAPANRPRRLGRPGEPVRPSRSAAPAATVLPSPVRLKTPAAHASPPEPAAPASESTTAPPPAAANTLGQLWPLWILLGAVLGGGLRFVPLSTSLLPVLVGLGVALLVVVALSIMARQTPQSARTRDNARGRSRSREQKKTPARSEPRKDPISRLASLTNGTATRRKPRSN